MVQKIIAAAAQKFENSKQVIKQKAHNSFAIFRKNVGIFLSYAMQAFIVGYMIYSFIKGNYVWTIWSAITLLVTLIPLMVKRTLRVTLPWEINFLIVLSLYLNLIGEVFQLYHIYYPIYDKALHFLGSATIAIVGFVLVVIIEYYGETKIGKYMIMFFVIIFVMAIGAFWEIWEFLQDKFIGAVQMQDGLTDTMLDMIFNFAGGIIAAILGYFYLQKTPKERFIKKFIKS